MDGLYCWTVEAVSLSGFQNMLNKHDKEESRGSFHYEYIKPEYGFTENC
jgi:hypothetical protein